MRRIIEEFVEKVTELRALSGSTFSSPQAYSKVGELLAETNEKLANVAGKNIRKVLETGSQHHAELRGFVTGSSANFPGAYENVVRSFEQSVKWITRGSWVILSVEGLAASVSCLQDLHLGRSMKECAGTFGRFVGSATTAGIVGFAIHGGATLAAPFLLKAALIGVAGIGLSMAGEAFAEKVYDATHAP